MPRHPLANGLMCHSWFEWGISLWRYKPIFPLLSLTSLETLPEIGQCSNLWWATKRIQAVQEGGFEVWALQADEEGEFCPGLPEAVALPSILQRLSLPSPNLPCSELAADLGTSPYCICLPRVPVFQAWARDLISSLLILLPKSWFCLSFNFTI